MTHDGLLRRVVGPREPGDLRALRTRRLRRKPGDDASTPACFFAEPCGSLLDGEQPAVDRLGISQTLLNLTHGRQRSVHLPRHG